MTRNITFLFIILLGHFSLLGLALENKVIAIKNPIAPDFGANCPKAPLRLTNLLVPNGSVSNAVTVNKFADDVFQFNGLWQETNDGQDLEYAQHLFLPKHHDVFFDLSLLANKDLECGCLNDVQAKAQCEQNLKGPLPVSPFEAQRRRSQQPPATGLQSYQTLDFSALPSNASIAITQTPFQLESGDNKGRKILDHQKLYVFIPSVKSTLKTTKPKWFQKNPTPEAYIEDAPLTQEDVQKFLTKESIASTDVIMRKESVVINGKAQDIDVPHLINSYDYIARHDKQGLENILTADPGEYGYCITYGPLSGFQHVSVGSNGVSLPGSDKIYSSINSLQNKEAIAQSKGEEICPMLDWGVLNVETATRGKCPFGNGKPTDAGIEVCLPQSGQKYNPQLKKCECAPELELNPERQMCQFKCEDGTFVSDRNYCSSISLKKRPAPAQPSTNPVCDCEGKTGDIVCYGLKDDGQTSYYYLISCDKSTPQNKFPFDHQFELVTCEEKVQVNGVSLSCCQDYSKVPGLADACQNKITSEHKRDMKKDYTNPVNKQPWETIQD